MSKRTSKSIRKSLHAAPSELSVRLIRWSTGHSVVINRSSRTSKAIWQRVSRIFPSNRIARWLWAEIAKSCMWWWPYENICVVSDRPEVVAFDDRKRLHSDTGPAIKFRDGYAVFAWHGARVPAKIILDPKSITREDIMAEKNSEVSRAMAERLGWAEYMKRAETFLVDKWFDAEKSLHYELWDFKKRFDLTPRLLKMESPELHDGTRPSYVEPVHPGLKTCQAARKWQFWVVDCGNCKKTLQAAQVRHGDVQIITYVACAACGTPSVARWPEVEECNKSPDLRFEIEA